MKKKRFILSLGILSLMLMLLPSCNFGPKTETIIIPSREEDHTEDQGSRPFQVNKIYRLPDDFTSAGQLLGWTSSNSVIASYRSSPTERMKIKRLTHPYEQSEYVPGVHVDVPDVQLSPDGKYICEISRTAKGEALKLISLQDGKETEAAKFRFSDQMILVDAVWSSNSKYLGYLVSDLQNNGVHSLRLYNIETRTSKTYKLKDTPSGKPIMKINVSDDGRSVLLTALQYNKPEEKYIMMGAITERSEVEIQYEHQIGGQQNVWINNNQFAFLGTDGTLYGYDRRNGELSVLLDKVGNFRFSHDKKSIAYSLYDQDIIYAGKIQGKNVLYNEPIYRGILPSHISWSLDNKSLLIHGQKLFSPSQMTQTDSTVGQSFIIEFQ